MEDKILSTSQSCYPMVRSSLSPKKLKKLRRKWTKLNEDDRDGAAVNFEDNEEFINNYCDRLGQSLKYPYKNVKFESNVHRKSTNKLKRTMTQLRFTNYNDAVEPYLDECYDSQGYFVGYLPPESAKGYPQEVYLHNDPYDFPDQILPHSNLEHVKSSKYYELPGLPGIHHNMDYAQLSHVRSGTSTKSGRKKKKRYPLVSAPRFVDEYTTPCQEWEDIAYVQEDECELKEVYPCELEESQSCSTNLDQEVKNELGVKESITSKKTTSDRGCGSQRSLLLRNFKERLEADQSKVLVEVVIPKKKCLDEAVDDKKSEVEDKLESEKLPDAVSVGKNTPRETSEEPIKVEQDHFDSEPSILHDDEFETVPGTPCIFRNLIKNEACGDASPTQRTNETSTDGTKKIDNAKEDKEKSDVNYAAGDEKKSDLSEEQEEAEEKEEQAPEVTVAAKESQNPMESLKESKETECYDSPRTENQSMFSALSDPYKKYEDSEETLSNHEQEREQKQEHDAVVTNYNNLLKYSAEYQGIYNNSKYKQVQFSMLFALIYKSVVEKGMTFVGNIIKQWLDSFVKQSYTLGFIPPAGGVESNLKCPGIRHTDKHTQFPDRNENVKSVEFKEDGPRESVPEMCKMCYRCTEKRRLKSHRCVNSSVQSEDSRYEWLRKYPIDCIYLKVTKSNGEHSFINPTTKQEVKIYPMKDMKLQKPRVNQVKEGSSADVTDTIPEKQHTVFMQKKMTKNRFAFSRRNIDNGSSVSMSGANSIYSTEERHSASSETDGTYILENTPTSTA